MDEQNEASEADHTSKLAQPKERPLIVHIVLETKSPLGQQSFWHRGDFNTPPLVGDGLDILIGKTNRMVIVDGRYFDTSGDLWVYTAPEKFEEESFVEELEKDGWKKMGKSVNTAARKARD